MHFVPLHRLDSLFIAQVQFACAAGPCRSPSSTNAADGRFCGVYGGINPIFVVTGFGVPSVGFAMTKDEQLRWLQTSCRLLPGAEQFIYANASQSALAEEHQNSTKSHFREEKPYHSGDWGGGEEVFSHSMCASRQDTGRHCYTRIIRYGWLKASRTILLIVFTIYFISEDCDCCQFFIAVWTINKIVVRQDPSRLEIYLYSVHILFLFEIYFYLLMIYILPMTRDDEFLVLKTNPTVARVKSYYVALQQVWRSPTEEI